MIAPDGANDARAAKLPVEPACRSTRCRCRRRAGPGAGRGRDGEHLRTDLHIFGWDEVVAGSDSPAAHTRRTSSPGPWSNRLAGTDLAPATTSPPESAHHLRRVFQCRTGTRTCASRTRILGVEPDGAFARALGRPLQHIGDLAQRRGEAAARDRHAPGAVRQRRLRDLEQDLAGRASRCSAAGRSGCSRSAIARVRRWQSVAAETERRSGSVSRRGWARAPPSTSTRRRTPPAGSSSRTRASASTSSSRCPARRARSPTRSDRRERRP